ncbi:MAG: polymerase sigma factor, sigma-70 family [Chlorobi bacterium]|nr:polymerase sigma factor, sigma-70 family [Chlorobiota bacterium]
MPARTNHSESRPSDVELYYRMGADPHVAKLAFEELYHRFGPGVYRYCYRVIGNQRMAEDVFQETFINFYESARGERVMINVEAYLLRIARNLSLNAKKSKHNDTLPIEQFDPPADEFSYERKETDQLVVAALDSLPADYREALVLREYNGLSYSEISNVVGASVATVRIRIFRAKRKLRGMLTPYLTDLLDHD